VVAGAGSALPGVIHNAVSTFETSGQALKKISIENPCEI